MVFEFPALRVQEGILEWEQVGCQVSQHAVTAPRTPHIMNNFASFMHNKLDNKRSARNLIICVHITWNLEQGCSVSSHILDTHYLRDLGQLLILCIYYVYKERIFVIVNSPVWCGVKYLEHCLSHTECSTHVSYNYII